MPSKTRSSQQPTTSGALISTTGGSGSDAGLTATQPALVDRIAPICEKARECEEGKVGYLVRPSIVVPSVGDLGALRLRHREDYPRCMINTLCSRAGRNIARNQPPYARSRAAKIPTCRHRPCSWSRSKAESCRRTLAGSVRDDQHQLKIF